MQRFSDHIAYVDESGDHSLVKVDNKYPVFVLAFCLFDKERYVRDVAPSMIRFKFKHFGHDQVILHGREIRKERGDFARLRDKRLREPFLNDLNTLVEQAPFTLVAVVIRKERLAARYDEPANPYHLALEYGLERLYRHLSETLGCREGALHVVFEKRGKTEDRNLELEFRRVRDGKNKLGCRFPFEFVLADKKGNSTGLQLADLVARPIGNHILHPHQASRSWEILESKFRRSPADHYEGWGLKVFP